MLLRSRCRCKRVVATQEHQRQHVIHVAALAQQHHKHQRVHPTDAASRATRPAHHGHEQEGFGVDAAQSAALAVLVQQQHEHHRVHSADPAAEATRTAHEHQGQQRVGVHLAVATEGQQHQQAVVATSRPAADRAGREQREHLRNEGLGHEEVFRRLDGADRFTVGVIDRHTVRCRGQHEGRAVLRVHHIVDRQSADRGRNEVEGVHVNRHRVHVDELIALAKVGIRGVTTPDSHFAIQAESKCALRGLTESTENLVQHSSLSFLFDRNGNHTATDLLHLGFLEHLGLRHLVVAPQILQRRVAAADGRVLFPPLFLARPTDNHGGTEILEGNEHVLLLGERVFADINAKRFSGPFAKSNLDAIDSKDRNVGIRKIG